MACEIAIISIYNIFSTQTLDYFNFLFKGSMRKTTELKILKDHAFNDSHVIQYANIFPQNNFTKVMIAATVYF